MTQSKIWLAAIVLAAVNAGLVLLDRYAGLEGGTAVAWMLNLFFILFVAVQIVREVKSVRNSRRKD